MTVEELRSALYYMPQNARVNICGGCDPHYGTFYSYVEKIEQENVGWVVQNIGKILKSH